MASPAIVCKTSAFSKPLQIKTYVVFDSGINPYLIPKRIWVGNLEDVISNKQQILFEHLICAKS